MMAPFLVFVFIVTCVTASAQTPAIMITLRCCSDGERPLAMGVQFLIMRLLAYIPVSFDVQGSFDSFLRRQCILERRLIWHAFCGTILRRNAMMIQAHALYTGR